MFNLNYIKMENLNYKLKKAGITLDTKIYNGFSVFQILQNLPKNMDHKYKLEYIDNCIFVYLNEKESINIPYCQLVRNSNFNLIKLYNNF